MTLRIALVIHTDADPHTAVYMNTMRRVESLRRLGHTVEVVTPARFRIDVRRLRPVVFPLMLACCRELWRADVVVFHSHAGWAFNLLRSLRRQRRPRTVTEFHGLEPLYHAAVQRDLESSGETLSVRFRALNQVVVPLLLKRSCRRSSAVFCLNRAEAAYLVQHRWCDPSSLTLVANGVEAAILGLDAVPRTGRRVLFVGQWLRAKGIRYLAAAFAQVAALVPDVELVCAGTRAPGSAVLADFPAAVRDRIRVIPQMDRTQLIEELRAADLFLFPTLSEGFSGALLEAMAAGCAIVATPVGAAPDLLEPGTHALLVPCADADALARAAVSLLRDPVQRERLGRAARERASTFTWEAVNEAWVAALLKDTATSGPLPEPAPHAARF